MTVSTTFNRTLIIITIITSRCRAGISWRLHQSQLAIANNRYTGMRRYYKSLERLDIRSESSGQGATLQGRTVIKSDGGSNSLPLMPHYSLPCHLLIILVTAPAARLQPSQHCVDIIKLDRYYFLWFK
jgi:hypothetical protein